MGLVKIIKSKSYFSRYRVKRRRLRKGLTNYAKRKRYIRHDMRRQHNGYFRFVVRIFNKHIRCQVVKNVINGDHTLVSAHSSELKKFGVHVGLSNYSAAYLTGFLCARRMLQRVGLDQLYHGKKKIDGRRYMPDAFTRNWDDDEKVYRPFKALLDIGLKRPSKGGKVFGAMKGASDAGLYIPHGYRNFPGYTRAKDKDDKNVFIADDLADKIFGQNTAEYMKEMQENNPGDYEKRFSQYIKLNIGPDDLEPMYRKAISKIRKAKDLWDAKVSTEKEDTRLLRENMKKENQFNQEFSQWLKDDHDIEFKTGSKYSDSDRKRVEEYEQTIAEKKEEIRKGNEQSKRPKPITHEERIRRRTEKINGKIADALKEQKRLEVLGKARAERRAAAQRLRDKKKEDAAAQRDAAETGKKQ